LKVLGGNSTFSGLSNSTKHRPFQTHGTLSLISQLNKRWLRDRVPVPARHVNEEGEKAQPEEIKWWTSWRNVPYPLCSVPDPKLSITDPDPQIENHEFFIRIRILDSDPSVI